MYKGLNMSELKANNTDLVFQKNNLFIRESASLIITEDDDIYINTQPNKEKKIKKNFSNFVGNIEVDENIVFNSYLLENCVVENYRFLKKDLNTVSVIIKNSLINEFTLFNHLAVIPIVENMDVSIEDSFMGIGRIMFSAKNLNLSLKNFDRKYDRKAWDKVCTSNLVYFCKDKLNINFNGKKVSFLTPFKTFIKFLVDFEKKEILEKEQSLAKQKEQLESLKCQLETYCKI
jgi:hypothetical protein